MNEKFQNWLVGFTEGDGSFSVNHKKNSWSLCYKLTQSTYNIKLIYYIKKMLKVGTVSLEKERNLISFKIRDKESIKKILFPIFDKCPLITSKKLDYEVFKKACIILDNPTLTQHEKNILILKLKDNLKIVKDNLSNNNFKDIENYNTISMNND